MKLKTEALWAGTEASLHDYLEAMEGAEAYTSPTDPGEEDKVPRLFELQGDIGVISVKGPLTNRDAWYNSLLGITSYNDIREAVIHAAQSPDVAQILLDVDSGGGAVNGVADTANLIRMVHDKVKPVAAFTDGTMASAAYWLGSSAGKVYASKTAMVGSIGVIATHMERSKMLKEAGIGVTVMRAGKYKALANGVEPLTEEAKAQMQAHLDAAYKVFVQHVAEARNVSYDLADSQMAQGREFMGEAAVGAGLIDGLESYDTVFNRLSKDFIDTSENLIDNSPKFFQQERGMGKKALTDTEIAAIAEGAGADPAAAADPQAAVDPQAADPVAADPSAAADPQAAAEPPAEPAAKQADVVEFLQSQIKDKDAALLAANVELSGLKKQVEDMEAAHTGLLEIAAKSVSNMQVALGGTAVDASGMSATQLLAEHKRVSAMFTSKFKAGGVSATDAAHPGKGGHTLSSVEQARLNAVRRQK